MNGWLIYFICLSVILNVILFFIIIANKTKHYYRIKVNRPLKPKNIKN